MSRFLAAALLAAAAVLPLVGLNAPVRAAEDPLQRLAGLLEQRLALAEAVARAKWNSGAAIHDPARERSVIEATVAEAAARGVEPAFARRVIAAQIEASRLVQEALHARWRAEGRGPFTDAPDLTADLRPRFDVLGQALVEVLAEGRSHLASDAGRAAFTGYAATALAARDPAVAESATAPFRAR